MFIKWAHFLFGPFSCLIFSRRIYLTAWKVNGLTTNYNNIVLFLRNSIQGTLCPAWELSSVESKSCSELMKFTRTHSTNFWRWKAFLKEYVQASRGSRESSHFHPYLASAVLSQPLYSALLTFHAQDKGRAPWRLKQGKPRTALSFYLLLRGKLKGSPGANQKVGRDHSWWVHFLVFCFLFGSVHAIIIIERTSEPT